MTAKIAYFAHDLADPAVQRRVQMLAAGNADVMPIGFRRGSESITAIAGIPAVEIGRSADGKLVDRALSVAGALARLAKVASHMRGSDVIVARNLEMLVLAARARKRYAPAARLVYECLDIHRMLLSNRLDGTLLRLLESRLWREVDLLLTSSSAFVRNYFAPRGFSAPVRIVENKMLLLDGARTPATLPKRPLGPPWRIGWFGMIRCRNSLDILSAIARAMGGAVEVIVRGRPSGATFADFEQAVAGRPHVHYAGPYRNPDDLLSIYGDVHFVWAVDYYESGQNSAWLLPNRIYEGSFYGAVPIGLTRVETGRWLTEHAVGVTLDEPLRDRLVDFFQRLDQSTYAKLAGAVDALPRADLVSDRTDCCELVNVLCGAAHEPAELRRSDSAQSVAFAPETSSLGARR